MISSNSHSTNGATILSPFSKTTEDCKIRKVVKAQLCTGVLNNNNNNNLHLYRILLGGCPFNGPLSGTKYPTRAASPIQNAVVRRF